MNNEQLLILLHSIFLTVFVISAAYYLFYIRSLKQAKRDFHIGLPALAEKALNINVFISIAASLFALFFILKGIFRL